MRKIMSLLLALAVVLTGFLPQTAGAAELYEYNSVSAMDATDGPAVIQNYAMPSIYTASDVFSLKADNEAVPVIKYLPEYDYAEFSFAGTVSIEVTADEPITSYSISPLAKNIKGTVDGNKLTFTLSASTYVIVDINEDPNEKVDESDPAKIRKRLVIAADPLETDIPDPSAANVYDVTAEPYNADNTGATMASDAIQDAIDDAYEAEGGTVYVPAGVYTSSNLTLKSNVTLYLAGGAVIVGTGNGEDYRNDFRKDSLNADGTYFIRTEVDSENITVRGRGTIDGKGVEMRKHKMTNPPSTHNLNEGFVNNLLVPIATSNFKFDGVTLRDGGFWAFLVVRSENVTITNYKGYQNLRMLEDDAIDINESQNVLVKHAIAISDDDAFSTKTWPQKGMSKDWPGAIENLVNVVFDDCLAWTRCSAFKLGMGICTPQIGVTIRNSYVYQSARALLVDHAYTSNPLPVEGYAQDVTFENIDIERVGINQFGNYWFRVSTSTSGDVSNILFKNINVRQTGGQSPIQGNPTKGGMVDGLTFTDIYVKGQLARSLSDLNAAVKNENVRNVAIANTTPALFSDNFEDGDSEGWAFVTEDESGSWSVLEDGGKFLSAGGSNITYLATAGAGASWSDYTYEAKVKLPFINGKENAGLVFRVVDEDNFYMYRINAKSDQLELYKWVDGAASSVAVTPFTSAKQWYTVKVDVHGNSIKGYVDGVLKTEWTNPASELREGGVGFRTTSGSVLFDDVTVTAINEAPTDITLSNDLVAENTISGSTVGTFSTADLNEEDTFAYSLVEGEGDTDNGDFSIAVLGNTLILRTKPDYETKDSYSIRVRSTDSGGLYYEKSLAIHIIDVDETPVQPDLDDVLYSNDFEDGDMTGWTSTGGNWLVETDDTKVLTQKNNTTGLITTGDAWTDYAFETKAKVDITNANAGIVFRVQDNENFYMYRINASNKSLELYKSVDGSMTKVSSTSFTAASKQWYTLRVIVQGNTIKGYVDNELKVEWTNLANELTEGGIGFRTTSVDTSYDDVLVTGLKQEQQDAEQADASNNIVVLDQDSIQTGETVTITAAGDRQNAVGTVIGEERYYPAGWLSTEADKSGVFTVTDAVYASDYTPSAAGQYEIDVLFQKQSWDGTAWMNDDTIDTKTVSLTVNDEVDNGGETAEQADASHNTVSLDRNSVEIGDTITITAAGDRQDAVGTVIGDERYYPTGWLSTEADKSGSFTVADAVYSSDYTTSAAGQYEIEVSFQKQSWDGTAWIDNTVDTKTVSLTVNAADDNGDTDNEGETPSSPATDNEDTGNETPANGIGTESTNQVDGNSVTTVSILPDLLEQKLSQDGKGATIIIPVNTQSDKVVVALTGQMVKSMEAQDAVLQIKTEKGTYTLSAAQINMDAVRQQLGAESSLEDIELNITIATPAAEIIQQVQNTANQQGYQMVTQPVEFKITARSGSNSLDVSKFNSYVERTIVIPDGIALDKITTGVVLNADGTFSHVPTKLVMIDGKPYAQINSLTNSAYTVIYNSKAFADVNTHWAKDAINELGSRLVIEGTGEGKFEPERDITRAEFTAIIIKGLGIMRPGSGKNTFSDVSEDSWYYDSVAIAHEYGIIDGFEDATFRPMDQITREQAMTMIARAMKLTGLKAELAENEMEQLLADFEDGSNASEYALSSIASCLKTGIINGRDEQVLAPASNITRAEVAVIVTRLLQKSELMK